MHAHRLSGDDDAGLFLDKRFRIVRRLSEGSMGIVYEGVQLPFNRPVAIKVMREELGGCPGAMQRFLREVRMASSVTHPHIVDVIDYGETDDGRLYLVMELLRGETLDFALAAAGCFSVQRTCEIAIQVADALAAAHDQGVVHRDLKPANIILLPHLGNWVKVLDFGLAKPVVADGSVITYAGAVLGTPLYMAPETVRCGAADPRSDLYALGCMIFEFLTGASPFHGTSGHVVLARQLEDPPPPLPSHVPASLRQLVDWLLEKEPEDRPSSAREVREYLEACLEACLATHGPRRSAQLKD
jgi:serine/threonine-protein kinase